MDDSLYSIDQVSDNFWPSPSTESENTTEMRRSSSECAFQRLLDEILRSEPQEFEPHPQPSYHSPIVFDREFGCVPDDDQSQNLTSSEFGSQVTGPWNGFLMPQVKDDGEPHVIPLIPELHKISGAKFMQAASGSSRDQSDDDDLDEETETTDNMEPTDERRVRRKESNRESAKRSRRRKQEQLSELETQTERMKIEKSSLLKLLNEWDRKYNEAAIDNRVLKANIETLRAKVMLVEDKVKRVKGFNLSPFQSHPDMNHLRNGFPNN